MIQLHGSRKKMRKNENNDGLDLAGYGKIAKAIPPEAYKEVIDTACDTFKDLVAPVTATTRGVGELIQAKFDRLIGIEKAIAAQTIQNAKERARDPNLERASLSLLNIYFREGIHQDEKPMQDLWSNVMAASFDGETIHPELCRILGKMTSQDTVYFIQVAQSHLGETIKTGLKYLSRSLPYIGALMPEDKPTFYHEHLERLGLIKYMSSTYLLTETGRALHSAISNDSLDSVNSDE